MIENNKSKKFYEAIIQAGRRIDLGNGLAVINTSDDHLKVTFETLKTVEQALIDKIVHLEKELERERNKK